MSFVQSFAPLLGRLLMAALFVWSGYAKLTHLPQTASRIASVHVPFHTPAAMATGALEIMAGVVLALGLRARSVAGALALYVLVVTWFFHWPHQTVEMLKNGAILAGLLGIMAHGPGRFSVNG